MLIPALCFRFNDPTAPLVPCQEKRNKYLDNLQSFHRPYCTIYNPSPRDKYHSKTMMSHYRAWTYHCRRLQSRISQKSKNRTLESSTYRLSYVIFLCANMHLFSSEKRQCEFAMNDFTRNLDILFYSCDWYYFYLDAWLSLSNRLSILYIICYKNLHKYCALT